MGIGLTLHTIRIHPSNTLNIEPNCTMKIFYVLLLVFTTVTLSVNGNLQCIDEEGKPVDWFIVYKLPYLTAKDDDVLFSGFNYAYMTSNGVDSWHLSKNRINDADKSILAKTLSPILGKGNKDTVSTVFYSDQPPTDDNVASSYAHSKGVLATDNKQGFWLIHSVPRFVSADKSYEYPSSGGRYGQVAMCISLPAVEVEKVVEKNFLVAHPYVYSISIGSESSGTLGPLLKKLQGHHWTSTPYSDTELTSIGGHKFRSFYKSPNDHLDLYAGIVAQKLETSLLVETWRKNPGNPLDSECKLKKEQVENVDELKLKFGNSDKSDSFDYLNDHSKWAISTNHQGEDKVNSVCLGDINRMESQFKRGGGTTCIFNQSVWKSFNGWILKYEKCNKNTNNKNQEEEQMKNSKWNFKFPKWIPFSFNITFPKFLKKD